MCAQAVAGEWEIENVVVAAGFLRRGIASELVHELIQRAQSEAAPAILLEVRESNLPARGLYEKHGFREVGRRRAYYRDPVEDAILYALRLRLTLLTAEEVFRSRSLTLAAKAALKTGHLSQR